MSKTVVIYRWPNQLEWTILEGESALLHADDSSSVKGFLIAPFIDAQPEIISVDRLDQTIEFPEDRLVELYATYKSYLPNADEPSIEPYSMCLTKAIDAVSSGALSKVVISRKQFFESHHTMFADGLNALAKANPSTFVYCLFSPVHGVWFGASPEVLVEEKQDSFLTMALAGTIKSEKDILLRDWKQKELDEHEFVSAYLREKLSMHSLEFKESSLGISRSGNIHHLIREYRIVKTNSISLLSLAKLLHPTPAICGMPTALAKAFISVNENYDRELYTGFIGPVGMKYNNGLFVNLRCGKLAKNGMVLFAGGGINKGSIAANELQETKNKMENTLRFFI